MIGCVTTGWMALGFGCAVLGLALGRAYLEYQRRRRQTEAMARRYRVVAQRSVR